MTALAPLMSSERDDWNTPEIVLERVRAMGPIGLDPCGNAGSIVGAETEWRLERDGDSLHRDWSGHGLVYCNPPYGRLIRAWVAKCRETSATGAEVIALVPARPDTRWWHESCAPPAADAVCFWRGRLTFLGAPAGAPFPSAIIYFGDRPRRFQEVFAMAGSIWC